MRLWRAADRHAGGKRTSDPLCEVRRGAICLSKEPVAVTCTGHERGRGRFVVAIDILAWTSSRRNGGRRRLTACLQDLVWSCAESEACCGAARPEPALADRAKIPEGGQLSAGRTRGGVHRGAARATSR